MVHCVVLHLVLTVQHFTTLVVSGQTNQKSQCMKTLTHSSPIDCSVSLHYRFLSDIMWGIALVSGALIVFAVPVMVVYSILSDLLLSGSPVFCPPTLIKPHSKAVHMYLVFCISGKHKYDFFLVIGGYTHNIFWYWLVQTVVGIPLRVLTLFLVVLI